MSVEEIDPKISTEEQPAEPKIEEITDDKKDDGEDSDDMPDLESQDKKSGKKLSKGEKKCRKALGKIGMKSVGGITRVTLKKKDGVIFCINDPEVLKSPTNENCYVIFGEMKYEDPNMNMAKQESKTFTEPAKEAPAQEAKMEEGVSTEDAAKPEEGGAAKEAAPVEEEGEALNEEGLTVMHIDMVMQHTKCTRNAAIKALRETNDDMVNAIIKLTQ